MMKRIWIATLVILAVTIIPYTIGYLLYNKPNLDLTVKGAPPEAVLSILKWLLGIIVEAAFILLYNIVSSIRNYILYNRFEP